MSNVSCPQCGAEVNNQFGFGMVECSSCKHVFMAETASVESQPEAERERTEPAQPVESFQDVVSFANKEVTANSSGALYYDLEISGLDTPELKKELEAILEDKKLGLIPVHILTKISNGVLKLKQLHPVKAAVLVNKLRQTNLKVKWRTDQMIKSIITVFILCFICLEAGASTWEGHDTSLKGSAIRINNLQDEIRDQIIKKNNEQDLKKREELLVEIKKKYQDLKGAYRDFLKEMEHVRYMHPERGDKAERKYRHYKVKTLEELENDNSFDGQLTKIKRKVEMQYKKENHEPK